MTEKKDSISETILRWGARKRARMEADSRLGFRSYTIRILLILGFTFLDGIFIPSAFQSLGLLRAQFVVPMVIVLVAVVAVEVKAVSRVR